MTTATARSMTFPRRMKSLNPLSIAISLLCAARATGLGEGERSVNYAAGLVRDPDPDDPDPDDPDPDDPDPEDPDPEDPDPEDPDDDDPDDEPDEVEEVEPSDEEDDDEEDPEEDPEEAPEEAADPLLPAAARLSLR
jgi:outer membrane biosynthesis protein TonB